MRGRPVARFEPHKPSFPWTIAKLFGGDPAEDYAVADLPPIRTNGSPGQMLHALGENLRMQLVAKGQVPLDWKTKDVIANVVYGGEPLAQVLLVATAGELSDLRGQLENALDQRNELARDLVTIEQAYTKLVENELPDLNAKLDKALERIEELELRAGGPDLEGPGVRLGLDDGDAD